MWANTDCQALETSTFIKANWIVDPLYRLDVALFSIIRQKAAHQNFAQVYIYLLAS